MGDQRWQRRQGWQGVKGGKDGKDGKDGKKGKGKPDTAAHPLTTESVDVGTKTQQLIDEGVELDTSAVIALLKVPEDTALGILHCVSDRRHVVDPSEFVCRVVNRELNNIKLIAE